jgi:transcriptional regulator with XRE-family HTH domain
MELDFQENIKETQSEGFKSKTSLRMLYEAKANLIRKQLGGLKGVQSELQLSQRKLAQLLMVDPSTWTRWVKNEDSIPPHIWRSLEWYLALQDKVPGLTAQHFIGRSTDEIEERFIVLQKELKEQIYSQMEAQNQMVFSKLKIAFWILGGMGLLNLIFLTWSVFRA